MRVAVIDRSKLKTEGGVRHTQRLFLEMSYENKSNVLYTLKNEDHSSGYLSLYRLYMQESDPTEWHFAQKYFDSWEHWCMICKTKWFQPYIERWRTELALKIKAVALRKVMEQAKSGGRDSFQASKYLLEKNFMEGEIEIEGKKKAKAGRPSKESIKQEAEKYFSLEKEIEADLKRMN